MDLLDRLRPRWRHPDADVRAAAVREMGEEQQERLGALAAGDPDPRVRRAAVKRLSDPALLARLLESETDEAVRALADERRRAALVRAACADGPAADCEAALRLLVDEHDLAAVAAHGVHEAVRRTALGRIAGDRALRDVVRTATDPALRGEALGRIGDAAILRSIAVSDVPPDLAVRAVERVDDVAMLRAIAESRSVAKAVRQRARALVPAADAPVAAKDVRARQTALSTAVHALRAVPDLLAAAERVREAEREWRELAAAVAPPPELAERFAKACEAILSDATSLERRLSAADHAERARVEGRTAREALCARVEALEGADAPGALAAARAEWARLPALDGDDAVALARRFALAGEGCEVRHRAFVASETIHGRLESVVGEAEALAAATPLATPAGWKALDRRWRGLHPGGAPDAEIVALEQRLALARDAYERRRREADAERAARQDENLRRLEALCARLRELAAADTRKPAVARRELESAAAALADLGPLPASAPRAEWTGRLSAARDELLRRVRQDEETEEWRRWANVGGQEALIARIEALLESNDLAEATRQLGRLQEEWAAVATASRDKSQALWERFRTARNELRRRCDAYLAENLAKKRALVAQAAGVGESTAWNETAELVRRLQAEWKTVGPVPGRHAKALWQEFRAPCDSFFARRTEHFARVDDERRANAAAQAALCERAEALADSTDWEATTAAVKGLQAEWKRTGPAPRDQADALWQRFRAACDRFFDRRSRRAELAREEAMGRARAACDALDAVAASLDAEEPPATDVVARALDEAWGAWLHVDAAAVDAPLAARAREACERIVARRPECLRGTRLDPAATRKRREKLCARVEALAPGPAEPARPRSLQEMALALRDRLATNTMAAGGVTAVGGRREDVARELERLDASWSALGPSLDDEARALAARFEAARARVRGPRS